MFGCVRTPTAAVDRPPRCGPADRHRRSWYVFGSTIVLGSDGATAAGWMRDDARYTTASASIARDSFLLMRWILWKEDPRIVASAVNDSNEFTVFSRAWMRSFMISGTRGAR